MKTALITGASGGIGAQFARVFAESGWSLVLVARSEGKLTDLAGELREKHGTRSDVVVKDLSLETSAGEIFAGLGAQGVDIDALVNNAGITTYGPFSGIPLSDELEELQINVIALTQLTKLFIAPMIDRGHGYVLNVASTAAFLPGPFMATYYASKAYVVSFSQALMTELRGSGVSVTCLCPGAVKTGFQARAKMPPTAITETAGSDAARVARAGYRGMMRRKSVVIPGAADALGTFLLRFASQTMAARIVRRLNAPVSRAPRR